MVELIQNPGIDASFLRNYYEDFDHIEVISDYEYIVHWSGYKDGARCPSGSGWLPGLRPGGLPLPRRPGRGQSRFLSASRGYLRITDSSTTSAIPISASTNEKIAPR